MMNSVVSNEKSVKQDSDDVYDPLEHRQIKKPTSDMRSTANLIKASLGSGLLAGPLAFANAGWGVGLAGTIIIGIICGHCIHILVTTSRGCCKIEKKPSLGYADTCRSAFANGPKCVRRFAGAASVFAEFALLLTYVGVCCIYSVLISASLEQIVERYAPSVNVSVEYYSLMLLVPICIICQIKHLKFLAVFSLVANILLVATYVICLYYLFGDGISVADKNIAGDPARYPAFISTVIFAMEGIGVVMPIENTMKKPKHFLGFPSVLVVAMSVIVFLYSTLGIFGYLRYGNVLRGTITLNLPTDEWPAIFAKLFIALSIFLTYPLQYYVVIDIFTKYTQPHIQDKYQQITQIVARTVGVCCCVGIGIALPHLEQIINVVGAVFYSTLGLVIPAIIETVFRWNNLGRYKWVFWKNLLIVLFGLGSLVSGCTVTIMDIIKILRWKTV